MLQTILGIDPGFYGAFCFYNPYKAEVKLIEDMPIRYVKKRKHIDIDVLINIIEPRKQHVMGVVLEQVGPMPRDGAVSAFRFGEGFGILQAVLKYNKFKMLTPRPNIWKPIMEVTAEKESSRLKAIELVDDETAMKYFSRKKDHNRAEATLLAIYGVSIFLA